MSFDGTEGSTISYSRAHDLTDEFQSNNPGHIKAVYFGKDVIQNILDQDDCQGIRIYYGKVPQGSPTLVLVGADSSENDQVDGDIVDNGVNCPPICGNANNLNNA